MRRHSATRPGRSPGRRFLHPARSPLWTAERTEDGFDVTEAAQTPEPRYAFLGVRACDLHAIAVLDRVLGGVDRGLRAAPGAAVRGGGVVHRAGGDLLLRVDRAGTRGRARLRPGADRAGRRDGVRYVVDAAYAGRCRRSWTRIATKPAPAADGRPGARGGARRRPTGWVGRCPRSTCVTCWRAAVNAARWDEVAARCLSCGNCTMVCPTCFCTTVEDTTDVTGEHAQRWLRWDSCFDLDFSYLHGGAVRTSTRSRYRQWLSHKLGTWHDQFGESGCVGCGRCIVWCPVGIDITEEMAALAAEREVS